jgi:hypothetical protein
MSSRDRARHPSLSQLPMKNGLHRRGLRALAALIALAVGACSSIGPATVPRDRIDYGSAIGDSWKQQTLLNIVKLRYGDFPVFLEIAQVIAGYQLESTASAGFNAANNSSGNPAQFTALGGSVLLQGKYTDRPTLIYAPLTGTDFLKRLMTPIPPSAVLFVLQSGYAADLVMPIAIDSINGLNNASRRGMTRPADPRFSRLVQLLREMQLASAIEVRIQRAQDGAESSLLLFGTDKDPQVETKREEIANLLGLRSDLREAQVYYGGYSGKDNEIAMQTRSMLQIMLELSAIVEVPASDMAEGKAAAGLEQGQTSEAEPARILHIASSETPPNDAYVSVPYRDRWFWIPDSDIRSKYTFGFVMLLFSISDTGVRGAAPVVTVPTN